MTRVSMLLTKNSVNDGRAQASIELKLVRCLLSQRRFTSA
jgi:hypothetical protein